MENKKAIHWLSNAPWTATGYGNQTKVFLPRLKALGYDMSMTAFYGIDGAILNFEGIPIYPKRHQTYAMDVVASNAQHAKAGIVISLMDAWVCRHDSIQGNDIKWVPWFPIDSEPLPGPVRESVKMAYKRMVFSPFGVRMMEIAGIDCYYVPHGIDTDIFKPINKGNKPSKAARKRINFPADRFIVGIVSANKGNPSRKAFFEQLTAFKYFHDKHPEAFLYLHTYDGEGGYGFPVDLRTLLENLDLEAGKDFVFCNQLTYNFSFGDKYMNDMYNSLDVLINVSMGEGFGIPIVEAQASGCPVIIGGWTSMEDLCFSGHSIHKLKDASPFLTGIGGIQFLPKIAAIQDALEEEFNKPSSRKQATEGAQIYDADYVTENYWKPTLEDIFEGIDAEKDYAKAVEKSVDGLSKKEKADALEKHILDKCNHEFIRVGLYVDNVLVRPCKHCGAGQDKENNITEGFFKNPHGLKFHESDGLEWVLMKECEADYQLDDLDLDENSVVVDIGAHVGVVSMTLAKMYGCKVYGYEPHPGNHERLIHNIGNNGLNGLVHVLDRAVTKDGASPVWLYFNDKNSGGHSIIMDPFHEGEFESVDSTAFADILNNHSIINLLKIDCEGAEYEFLPGADLSNVKAIRGEFHGGREKGQALLDEVLKQVPNTKVTLLD